MIDQIADVGGTKVTFGDPANGLQVAKSTWRVFEIGFQVVFGVVGFFVAVLLFLIFSEEELFISPSAFRGNSIVHLLMQRWFTPQRAGLDQVGGDGDVFTGFGVAVINGANA